MYRSVYTNICQEKPVAGLGLLLIRHISPVKTVGRDYTYQHLPGKTCRWSAFTLIRHISPVKTVGKDDVYQHPPGKTCGWSEYTLIRRISPVKTVRKDNIHHTITESLGFQALGRKLKAKE
ncbi:hypothetical protein Salat_0549700 [Sesamum alatum]|uniref:Uncharacterized protein n=1 Tax=Sesamum alatum TaxID=300844 RepID=A0AAE1YP86_9LAMI|nr:hypothetical protein Salat_0549700 [Sesamum alatum]